jgi:hypothetical protein
MARQRHFAGKSAIHLSSGRSQDQFLWERPILCEGTGLSSKSRGGFDENRQEMRKRGENQRLAFVNTFANGQAEEVKPSDLDVISTITIPHV